MSRTRRIYNKEKINKSQRYNLDDEIKKDWNIRFPIVGIPYTIRSWICMGRCKLCRDPNKEPKILRKRRKEENRRDIKREFENGK